MPYGDVTRESDVCINKNAASAQFYLRGGGGGGCRLFFLCVVDYTNFKEGNDGERETEFPILN